MSARGPTSGTRSTISTGRAMRSSSSHCTGMVFTRAAMGARRHQSVASRGWDCRSPAGRRQWPVHRSGSVSGRAGRNTAPRSPTAAAKIVTADDARRRRSVGYLLVDGQSQRPHVCESCTARRIPPHGTVFVAWLQPIVERFGGCWHGDRIGDCCSFVSMEILASLDHLADHPAPDRWLLAFMTPRGLGAGPW